MAQTNRILTDASSVGAVQSYYPKEDGVINAEDNRAYQVIIRTIVPNCQKIVKNLEDLGKINTSYQINSLISNSGIGYLSEKAQRDLQASLKQKPTANDISKFKQQIATIAGVFREAIGDVMAYFE